MLPNRGAILGSHDVAEPTVSMYGRSWARGAGSEQLGADADGLGWERLGTDRPVANLIERLGEVDLGGRGLSKSMEFGWGSGV